MNHLSQLIEMSNRYGSDANYTLAGGGNTSYKEDGILYVKASGTKLATIDSDGFVEMSIEKLHDMLNKDYPESDDEREEAALQDMMGAVRPGQQGVRPSVECILHGILPYSYVLHLHPALVNGLTCGVNGKRICRELFNDAVWIPLTKPGYILGKVSYEAFNAHKEQHGEAPKLVFMQNHGLIVAANTVDELDAIVKHVMDTLRAQLVKEPDFSVVEASDVVLEIAPALRSLYTKKTGKGIAVFCANKQVDKFLQNKQSAQPILTPYTPDQIVYCKGEYLYVTKDTDLQEAVGHFEQGNGYLPKIVLVEGEGFFALGSDKNEAEIARKLFLDAMKIAVYSESFGGPLNLPKEFTDFILNWEAENYRQKVGFAQLKQKRMEGKVCVVTGGAQGFGEGIARGIARHGGYVVIGDLNAEGAQVVAQELCDEYGNGTATSAMVDVTEETSIAGLAKKATLEYGGIDVMVACAGILIAGNLEAMTVEKLEKVLRVNYTGYFLCAKYASRPMKIQRKYLEDFSADIIQINSKSGLEGSEANFAYAGSKFGGIGLTQSFALELAKYGIKVNAICPGNYLDGPLWSDPENGLFKQYFDAGKVPSAKTVEDVRKHYEGQELLGRACELEDIVVALLYLVEQQYETGQALPVSGGAVMLP